ncbi:MAG: aminoglycoside phosphotransferase family protein [Chloroflexi bacterium]|nr:aminoglycoside phosphotransferase family protein [Chloroflexota bacterium]
MAVEEAWPRRRPVLRLGRHAIQELIRLPVHDAQLLGGGLRNTNYRLRLRGEAKPVVLRLYTVDARACPREVALMRLVDGQVPVPRVFDANPEADPPWALVEWMEGTRFDQGLARASPAEVEQGCRSAGAVLAAMHRFTFPAPGFLTPSLAIGEPMGESWLAGVEAFFASDPARQLVGAGLAERLVQLVRREARRLEDVWDQASLVHADYKPWNLLVRPTASGWTIGAVLDWEFALAGPRLYDIGVFLRYRDRMPEAYARGFVDGYRAAGGSLPPDVLDLARLIDLVSLWMFLEHDPDAQIVRDVIPLLEASLAIG